MIYVVSYIHLISGEHGVWSVYFTSDADAETYIKAVPDTGNYHHIIRPLYPFGE